MKPKKLMVIGSGYNFCSLVNAAKKHNIYVVICDGQANGKAKEVADVFYQVNIQDLECLEKIARKEAVDGIITSFSDITLIPYIQIASKMNFKTLFDRVHMEKFIDKQYMKETFAKNGILSSNYQVIERLEEQIHLTYPLVAKPLKGSGSKGIFFINEYKDLKHNYNDIINNANFIERQLLIEEKIEGDEILIQAWIENGTPYISHIGDRILFYPCKNRPGQTNYNLFPSKYLTSKREEIYSLVKNVATAFEIKSGIVSIQAVVDSEGKIFVIEVMPRLTGGQDHLIQRQKTGVDMCEILVKYAVDDSSYLMDLEKMSLRCNADEYYFFVPLMCKEGIVGQVLLEEHYNKPYVTYVDTQVELGERTKGSGDMRQIKARVHGKASSKQEVKERVKTIRKESKILDINKENLVVQID